MKFQNTKGTQQKILGANMGLRMSQKALALQKLQGSYGFSNTSVDRKIVL
jgi:hypothetical protein